VKTLYELTEELLALEATLNALEAEHTEECTPEQLDALSKWLEELGEQHAAKIDGYAAYIRRLESEAAIAKLEVQRWQSKQKSRINRAEMLRSRMIEHMQKLGRKSLKTDRTEIAIVGNGGKLPVIILDHDKLPPEYFRTPDPVEDKAAIFEALDKGVQVPGAKLGERGVRLAIK
jgi:hypothetical protein